MQITNATTVLFVRHAHTDALGTRLCGRACGVSLSAIGQTQAIGLGEVLRSTPLAAIYSSPLERARATAAAIAMPQARELQICDELIEIDFGEWTGQTFGELEHDARWQAFNRSRGTAIIPGGEQPAVVQTRIVDATMRLAAAHPGTTIALVTHADIVRMALLYFLSRSIDLYHSLTIDPASISTVSVLAGRAQVMSINHRPDAHSIRAQCQV
jgi:broad specificity phosphatase PhoE